MHQDLEGLDPMVPLYGGLTVAGTYIVCPLNIDGIWDAIGDCDGNCQIRCRNGDWDDDV
jgi:hypothetical protein